MERQTIGFALTGSFWTVTSSVTLFSGAVLFVFVQALVHNSINTHNNSELILIIVLFMGSCPPFPMVLLIRL